MRALLPQCSTLAPVVPSLYLLGNLKTFNICDLMVTGCDTSIINHTGISVMTSSPDDIAAYLAHLKASTTKKNDGESPDEDAIDRMLRQDANLSDFSSSPSKSPHRNPLKSPQKFKSILGDIRKYEDKYINRSPKKLSRKSSVIFSVPESPDETASGGEAGLQSDDSMMDEVLAKCLQESSLSDDIPPPGTAIPHKESMLKNVLSAESLLSHDPSQPVAQAEPKVSRKNIFLATNKKEVFGGTKGGNELLNYKIPCSFPFESSDLKRQPENDNRTLSTTPDRSSVSLLRKNSKSIFHSSSFHSSSSESEDDLCKRISRKNSYVYKEGFVLMSATSTDDTIQTDSNISDEAERRSSEVVSLQQSDDEGEAPIANATNVSVHSKNRNVVTTVMEDKTVTKPSSSSIAVTKEIKNSQKFKIDNKEKFKIGSLKTNQLITTEQSGNKGYSSSFASTSSGEDLNSNAVGDSGRFDDLMNGSSTRITSSTEISIETSSSSERSDRHRHSRHKHHSRHKRRSHNSAKSSHKNRSRHRHKRSRSEQPSSKSKKKRRRRRRMSSCSDDYSSSSSSESSSCGHRRRRRESCRNCERLLTLLAGGAGPTCPLLPQGHRGLDLLGGGAPCFVGE
ncbi:E3 ubiquitin-protein ligase RBBP6-like [Hyalella azteca]|uniref:E3 ubiquitin-protein ligase RBBP6-like n=1 Tax=Hyalella azteca TaxID=294128 RepID=A0A979FST5_HYAAZ|nr:E3 ubiquitin-protein ligase RBBP6-like [Hyalella azteca]